MTHLPEKATPASPSELDHLSRLATPNPRRLNLRKKHLTLFYLAVIVLDLFFILFSSPLVAPASTGSVIRLIQEQLDLSLEANIATWYSSLLLFAGATLAGTAALLYSGARFRHFYRGGWLLVALLLVLISADEVAQIHERLAQLYNTSFRDARQSPVVLGAGDWVPLLMPAIAGSAAGLVVFLSVALRKHAASLIAALVGVDCWVGVILAESSEGLPGGIVSFKAERCLEEALELAGATLLLVAFSEFVWSASFSGDPARAADQSSA